MKKLVMLFLTVLFLAACGQNAQQPKNTVDSETVDQTDSTETSAEDTSTAKGEDHQVEETQSTQGPGPSEIHTQLETKFKERLEAMYIPEIDYRKSENDFGVLNSVTRFYSAEVPMIGQGEVLNSYYEWYDPKDFHEVLVNYHGFTIDFEKYRNANEEEFAPVYFDGDFVYLLSADFPGFNGVVEPVINSIEQFQDKPIYFVELQYKLFDFSAYEQAGYEWDQALREVPMDDWPEKTKEFIQLNETKIYAIFIENGDSLALAYYGTTLLSEEERIDYLDGLQFIQ